MHANTHSYHALSECGNVSERVVRHSLHQAAKFGRRSHSKYYRLVPSDVTDVAGYNL